LFLINHVILSHVFLLKRNTGDCFDLGCTHLQIVGVLLTEVVHEHSVQLENVVQSCFILGLIAVLLLAAQVLE